MTFAFIAAVLWKTFLASLALLLGVAFVVGFRLIGSCPSELDRAGSDLSLYGYGVGVSFLIGIQMGRPVLRWLRPAERVTLVVCLALLVNIFLYVTNLYLSKKMRSIDPRFSEGLDNVQHLKDILHNKTGRHLVAWSLSIGFLPTFSLVILDLVGE